MTTIVTRLTTGITNGTGSISSNTSSLTITGSGTQFLTEVVPGQVLKTGAGVTIGTVNSVNSNTTITLVSNAAVTVTSSSYTINSNGITVKGSPLSSVEIDTNFIKLNDYKLELSDATSTNTANKVVRRDLDGGFSAGSIQAQLLTLTTPLHPAQGGSGTNTVPGNGSILIGTSAGLYACTTLTGTANRITVTNASGSITLSSPQDISTSSNLQFGSLGVGTAASGTTGEIRATNQITSYYSDERLKENIEVITNALEKVMSLRGVTYQPNTIAEQLGYKKQNEVGVIAQDVKRVLPEAVKPAPFDLVMFENTEISRSGENYLTVQYDKIIPLLIEAIKDLNREIQDLKGVK